MTRPRCRIRFCQVVLAITLILVGLSDSLFSTDNASDMPEDYLEKMRDLPLPDKTLNDRGLLIEELKEYHSTYLDIAADFHKTFPSHPACMDLIEKELTLISEIRLIVPDPVWDDHLSFLINLYPEEIQDITAYARIYMATTLSQLSGDKKLSPEERMSLRKTAFNWATNHRTVPGANKFAYKIAVRMAREEPLAERASWFQRFRETFPDDPRGETMPTTEAAVDVGEPLTLKFKDIDGNTIDTAEFRGKTVVVDFWATWCGPCLAASEKLKKLLGKYGEDYPLQIIGVSTDQSLDDLKMFLEKNAYPWPIVWDGAQDEAGRWETTAIPYYLIIDPQGILRHRGNLSSDLQEVLDVLGVQEDEKATIEVSDEDLQPLVPEDANRDEIIETLLTGGDIHPFGTKFFQDTLKSYDGDQSRTITRMNQLQGAYAALVNNLAWRFLQDYPNDPRREDALKVWVSSVCSRYLVDAPELVKAKMVGGPDPRIQAAKMSQLLGTQLHREIELVRMVHDVRGFANQSITDENRLHWMQTVKDFCEAAPDDPLNALAFFETMSVLKKKGEDPAQSCHAPIRLVAKDIDGTRIDTKDWRGKVVLVYFGYYPQTHTPYLRQLWRELRGPEFELLELNLDRDISRLKEYQAIGKMYSRMETNMKESPIPWPIVSVDKRSPLNWLHNWQYAGYPSLCVLDREGRIRQTGIGWSDKGITVGNKNYRVAIDRAPIIHELVKTQ